MLLEQGYSHADINEIVRAAKKTEYSLLCDNERLTIGEKEAHDRLGHDEWLKGILRSAFHVETTRYGKHGEKIHLHSKIYL